MVLSSFRVVFLQQISRTLCVPLERVIQGSYRGYKRLLVLYQLRCTELCHVIAVLVRAIVMIESHILIKLNQKDPPVFVSVCYYKATGNCIFAITGRSYVILQCCYFTIALNWSSLANFENSISFAAFAFMLASRLMAVCKLE